MQNIVSLFHASPEACFEEIGASLDKLRSGIDLLSRRVDAISAFYEEYLKTKLPIAATVPMTRWIFEAGMANVYFSSTYPAEVHADYAKVWVDASGILSASLIMSRQQQYRFEITIRDFVDRHTEETCRLMVNGLHCPWVSTRERVYSTIIPEQPDLDTLEFVLSCAPGETNPTVSFSFSSIKITAI